MGPGHSKRKIGSPKVESPQCAVVGALVELHVRADLDDGVRYRVGLVLVALRLVVVEAVVVLHCRHDEARGQKGDQEGQCVPGREAHVWPSARDGSGTPVCPSSQNFVLYRTFFSS